MYILVTILSILSFFERCIDENKIILKDVMITFHHVHRIMNLVADFIWVKIGLWGGQKIVKKKNNFWHIVSQNFFPVFNTLKQIA